MNVAKWTRPIVEDSCLGLIRPKPQPKYIASDPIHLVEIGDIDHIAPYWHIRKIPYLPGLCDGNGNPEARTWSLCGDYGRINAESSMPENELVWATAGNRICLDCSARHQAIVAHQLPDFPGEAEAAIEYFAKERVVNKSHLIQILWMKLKNTDLRPNKLEIETKEEK